MDDQRTERASGRVRRASVRTSLGIALAVILGSLILAVGVFLLRTDPGKGNAIPGGVAWSVVSSLIVLGAIAKTCIVLRAEK
jgi:hypothetical protein